MKKPWKKIKIILLSVAFTTLAIFLFVNLRSPQKELTYETESIPPVDDPSFAKGMGDLLGFPFVSGNQAVVLLNGNQIFPEMLGAIRGAQKTICFESYIYWSGRIGKSFAEALSERARAGVKVHVLLDWVGSDRIDKDFIKMMNDAGVQIERFHEPRWYNVDRMNNRTHRKLLIVDGVIGFTGGVGIADEWNGDGLHPEKWRDSHFKVEGPVVNQMQTAFMDNWLKVRPEIHSGPEYFPVLEPRGKMLAQHILSSSASGSSKIQIMYLMAIAGARKKIQLQNAYFLPDEHTIATLIDARKRGVEIEVITPGPLLDSTIVRHASRELWEPMLEAGIKFYEYQPAMFHCKVMIVDGLFVSVGSTNFDERSFLLNDEANLNVLNREFAEAQISAFEADRARSKEITLQAWRDRPTKGNFIGKVMQILRPQL